MVEFAAVLPLLILLLMGIWEVGRMVDMGQIVNNAAREGARQAASGTKPIGPDTEDSIARTVKDYLRNAGVPNVDEVAVFFENETQPAVSDPRLARQGDQLKLTVSVPIDSNRWSLLPRMTTNSHITTSVQWRCMLDIPVTVNTSLPIDPALP